MDAVRSACKGGENIVITIAYALPHRRRAGYFYAAALAVNKGIIRRRMCEEYIEFQG